ncbi:MAG: TIM barrel protein [Treponema sp.]|jgi:sugar phosphate isomerase/epimerase|nr:TIM barrel protein [Treponema sp.]
MMNYPTIYLAIDNCFACKRWTTPEEWCRTISGLGIAYIEASADNELDPLFMGAEYLEDWITEVRRVQDVYGVKVANLYSGHGTYTTLGLTHTDPRVRRRMIDHWFKPMIRAAAALNAGLGFFAHAFPHRALQTAERYAESVQMLEEGLVELNRYAAEQNCRTMALEQMYSPHQYPWTIAGTAGLLAAVTKKSGRSFYFTEDLGHHHIKFTRPEEAMLARIGTEGAVPRNIWLGSDKAFALAKQGDLPALRTEMAAVSHLFSEARDGDCYAWLAELGAYSPIIHLQQSDGKTSSHLPFTEENKRWGRIDGAKVLRAIKAAYDKAALPQMPEPCNEIYLTLELFSGTASIMRDFMEQCKESAAYWRRFVPEDGLGLDELVSRLD